MLNFKLLTIIFSTILTTFVNFICVALPPPEDTPEEILRNEIITDGRSPLDNKPLTAAEYAELQAELAKSKYPPELSPKIRQIILQLQLLKLIRTINPF